MFAPYPAIGQSDPMQQMLAQVLGGYKPGQLGAAPTLGNEEGQQDYARQLAEALAQQQSAESGLGMADRLSQAEYAPNSGALGSIAMLAQAYAGKKLRGKESASQADAMAKAYGAGAGMRSQDEERKAKREAAAQAAELQAKIDAYNKNDPAMDAALGIKREKYAPDWRERTKADGSSEFFDINGGQPQQAQRQPPAQQGGGNYRDAIAGIESAGSGDYAAIGPQTKTGDRAYGRYQVMGANIPEWTKAALGRSMTPQEFAASPEAQDAVFDHRFGQYVQKYGPEGAAKAWFAGEGGMKNGGARDQLGTSVDQYGQKFMRGMGGMQEQYVDTASIPQPRTIPGDAPKKVEAKPSTVQQRRADLRELQASGQKVTQGMAEYYMLHGKFPDAPKPAAAGKSGMTGEVGNKVGLLNNAIRSAQQWHAMVAEKDAAGNFTGGYNNTAAMSSEAKVALNNAIRAKLRAESGASISPDELEGEVERYSARLLGGDTTDLGAANNLLNDLATQIKSLVGSGKSGGSGYQVGQVIEKGGKKYRVVGGDPSDPEVEEIR